MAVWYLDSDDEITDAVARMRNATDEHIVFVVPPGSRIATGRLNFKLLTREAASRGLALAIASPDAQVRAMAASAGVLALPSASEAQAALKRGDAPPQADEAGAGAVPEGDEGSVTDAVTDAGRGTIRWRGRRLAMTVVVVMAVAIFAVIASLQILPTAEITLAPRTVGVGPLQLTIMALTSVSEPNVEAGQIPAVELSIPLRVDGDFEASGSETVEERARGSVVFSASGGALDQEVVIQALTRVFTADGIEFRTTETATLRPSMVPSVPAQVAADIEAARPGPEGNVAAGTIDRVPSLESQGIAVTNPEPTSGGRLEEIPVVTRQDYDAAIVDLQNRLAGALDAHLRDPANVPAGLTVFEETAQPGAVTHDPPAEELVGTEAPDFRLSGAIAARVLAVDERLAAQVARGALLAAVPEDMALLPDTPSIDIGPGVAEGDGVRLRGHGGSAGLSAGGRRCAPLPDRWPADFRGSGHTGCARGDDRDRLARVRR